MLQEKKPSPKEPFFAPALLPLGPLAVLGGLAALFLSSKGPKLTTKSALCVPLEFWAGDKQYADWNQAAGIVHSWFNDTQAWIKRAIGMTFKTDFQLLLSHHTHAEFKGSSAGDACGDDFDFGNALEMLPRELGWSTEKPFKHLFIVIGGGGWAGATPIGVSTPGDTSGVMVVGDHELRNFLGVRSPCYTLDNVGCHTIGHEFLHTMNVDSHNPYVNCGDTLSQQQKNDLVFFNSDWLA